MRQALVAAGDPRAGLRNRRDPSWQTKNPTACAAGSKGSIIAQSPLPDYCLSRRRPENSSDPATRASDECAGVRRRPEVARTNRWLACGRKSRDPVMRATGRVGSGSSQVRRFGTAGSAGCRCREDGVSDAIR